MKGGKSVSDIKPRKKPVPIEEAFNKKETEEFIAEIMINKDKLIEGMLKSAHRKFNPNYNEEEVEKGRIKLQCLVPPNDILEKDNDELVNKWISAVEDSGGLKHIITFIKSTPGFKNVEMTDQIQIIKGKTDLDSISFSVL